MLAADPVLDPCDVHVWRIVCSRDRGWTTTATELLDADEHAKAARLVRAADREHFVLGRGALRVVLGGALGVAPHTLHFAEGEHGRPVLVGGGPVEFNVAHSGDIVLVALRRELPIGVDVELMREVDIAGLARRFMAPSEVAVIEAAPAARRELAFFDHWVHKEAYVKARGVGLSLGLDTFSVTVDRVGLVAVRDPATPGWSTVALDVGAPHRAALSGPGLDWRVHRHELTELR